MILCKLTKNPREIEINRKYGLYGRDAPNAANLELLEKKYNRYLKNCFKKLLLFLGIQFPYLIKSCA